MTTNFFETLYKIEKTDNNLFKEITQAMKNFSPLLVLPNRTEQLISPFYCWMIINKPKLLQKFAEASSLILIEEKFI